MNGKARDPFKLHSPLARRCCGSLFTLLLKSEIDIDIEIDSETLFFGLGWVMM